jgi:hypothetical protein
MTSYRALTIDEIVRLKAQSCVAEDWNKIQVADGFRTEAIYDVRFSGEVRMGAFDEDILEHDGFVTYTGIRHATLHNVTVGNDCLIENVGAYISNYEIGDQCYIRNIGSMMVTGRNAFGNGVTVAALNEGGTSAFPICAGLSAQAACVMALYGHRPALVAGLKQLVQAETERRTAERGQVGDGAIICDTRQIVNVHIGAGCMVNGASKLVNGTLLNEGGSECTVGSDVIAQDFILSGGAQLDNGVILTRCFVGQGSHLTNRFTATDCYIASNCYFENGEACSIFAGPYTVSHHKNTLLIAGQYSFMNAGSGTNQSNHLYKTGPIHQGILLRGTKTASSSHVVWPATIGAFSMVMGSVKKHPDTRRFPFSYLIGEGGDTWLAPGANFYTVGLWRDILKWPQRDKRVKQAEHDLIRFTLFTPYVLQPALDGYRQLREIAACPYVQEALTYQGLRLKRTAVAKGEEVYADLLLLGFAQAFEQRLQRRTFADAREFQQFIRPKTDLGEGEWTDLAGYIAPEAALEPLWQAVEAGQIDDLDELQQHLQEIDSHYEEYVWSWTYPRMAEVMGWTLTPEGDYAVDNYLQLVRDSVSLMHELTERVEHDACRDLQLAGTDPTTWSSHPFMAAIEHELEEVTTAAEDVQNCLAGVK